ncbi:MAG TPA: xanthine dehydrogenase family protein molybdopterin-binding subunit [Baekduia sp.]|uniref:xanthine dehydrogenase family protein molybdopterin-binding subunit n=1 Tax=Baekduia sp. TaxID=2600305 RepID=UPI002D77693E|nr:xanthine dehydrogenase family protein molybdopterin-binding subunit [Baekduia sp.]HET6508191.1 xanthine dehydrogenase family protein molybdopterin-binding subunit [Baekduia sp.]
MAGTAPAAVGAPLARVEGRDKVTGAARYAVEHEADDVAYAWIVQAAAARGRIARIDTARAAAAPGVLDVLTHENAPPLAKLDDPELYVLQDPEVHYRGQIVALVVADSLENAREAAAHVAVEIAPTPHSVILDADDPNAYVPEQANAGFPGAAEQGDPIDALAHAAVRVDRVYTTPAEHNNAMEPHASLARWDGDDLTVHDSNQGAATARDTLAQALDVDPEHVRVVNHHVGGGFGSKGTPRPQLVLAAVAARAVGRPVKLAITRQQMFAFVGYRTPTIQRVALGADADGRLVAIAHDATMQSSRTREFTEQTVVATRHMYAARNRRTRHRLVRLDVPTPSWMRAPGECPGMYALESAMDELAIAADLDPIELRIRNEPEHDPEKGIPFSSRNLVACLREGARRFGWDPETRDRTPGVRRDGPWLVGTGVAASTYPAYRSPATARVTREGDTYTMRIAATDLGTGARTALTQIAADALAVPVGDVTLELGDSALPKAGLAGGSMGTASWGTAIVLAARDLRAKGEHATEGFGDSSDDVANQEAYSRHAFGAQFCEVGVDPRTGVVRVRRHLGVFAAGRIINPRTARSQFLGGMTMGIGMALMEEGIMDLNLGDFVNHDLAQYHVPAHADILDLEAAWVDEEDPHLNPMGSKGIGEIGITGAAAAIANAVHHACGVRVRDLPIRLDRVLGALTLS